MRAKEKAMSLVRQDINDWDDKVLREVKKTCIALLNGNLSCWLFQLVI